MKYTKLLSGTFCVGKINCIIVKRDAGFSYNHPNGPRHNEFVYVRSGRVKYRFADNDQPEKTISSGDLWFIPQGCRYTAYYEEDDTLLTIIGFDLLVGELPNELSKPVQLYLHDSEKLIDNASTHPDLTEIDECRELYFNSKVTDLIRKSILSLRTHKDKALAKKLAPALLFISEHYAEEHPISHYAALCYMSETAFRRNFRAYTEMSPVQYRNKLRVEEADRLIRSGEYSVREAAEAVGFFNASFFTKTYKSFFGHTPLGEK